MRRNSWHNIKVISISILITVVSCVILGYTSLHFKLLPVGGASYFLLGFLVGFIVLLSYTFNHLDW